MASKQDFEKIRKKLWSQKLEYERQKAKVGYKIKDLFQSRAKSKVTRIGQCHQLWLIAEGCIA